jgi:hypothetical protein
MGGRGAWVAGLSAWRLNDCLNAAEAFARTAKGSTNAELTAAAYYWQSRAQVRCRQPEQASAPLRSAARLDETLYGMIAAEQLGLRLPADHATPDFTPPIGNPARKRQCARGCRTGRNW